MITIFTNRCMKIKESLKHPIIALATILSVLSEIALTLITFGCLFALLIMMLTKPSHILGTIFTFIFFYAFYGLPIFIVYYFSEKMIEKYSSKK